MITLCAAICGADDWVAIARFGRAKRKWFRGFLTLRHEISSHDTCGRVLAALDPEGFRTAFLAWVQTVADLLPGDVIAIDGKTLRHPCDTAGAEAAIHMVSAWAATQGLCRGQIETEAKPDEIAAVPTLLEVLALTGRVVTIDGMGCQTAIARTVGDHTTRETRDFISSLAPDAAHLARIVRSHWAIENGLHRVLDVAMHRDQTRIRTSDAPENLAILHHIPLNLLTQDHDYLLRVIMGAENWVRSPWDTSRHLHQPRAPRAMIPCLALSLRSRADVPSQQ